MGSSVKMAGFEPATSRIHLACTELTTSSTITPQSCCTWSANQQLVKLSASIPLHSGAAGQPGVLGRLHAAAGGMREAKNKRRRQDLNLRTRIARFWFSRPVHSAALPRLH